MEVHWKGKVEFLVLPSLYMKILHSMFPLSVCYCDCPRHNYCSVSMRSSHIRLASAYLGQNRSCNIPGAEYKRTNGIELHQDIPNKSVHCNHLQTHTASQSPNNGGNWIRQLEVELFSNPVCKRRANLPRLQPILHSYRAGLTLQR